MKFAVIAVGYNRPNSMLRLLKSLLKAEYLGDSVDLVISLDKGERQSELVEIAEKTEWPFGEKIVRAFSERQGLRSHILQCGDYTEKYDAVIVLEDDLIVSPGFYSYCKQMVAYYDSDERISGISLYKHRINTGVNRPFEPEEGPYDIYFMQVAQSWGECWSARMWKGFKNWYSKNDGDIVADVTFPEYISKWNKSSWLKYYNKYIVENDFYYVYPYKSLTTNHTDAGEHSEISNNNFQVPLLSGVLDYRCCPLSDGIKYDIFYERVGIKTNYSGKVLLDLMGARTDFTGADYLISVQRLPYKIVDELQLRYRPLEMNVIMPYEGKGIFVYDLHNSSYKPKSNSKIINAYDIRGIKWSRAFAYGVNLYTEALVRKVRKLKHKIKGIFKCK